MLYNIFFAFIENIVNIFLIYLAIFLW